MTYNVKTTNHFIQSYIETFVITVALGYEEGLKKMKVKNSLVSVYNYVKTVGWFCNKEKINNNKLFAKVIVKTNWVLK